MTKFSRRWILLVPLAAAACATDGGEAQTAFDPLSFDYLTKLRLSVGSVDIDDRWRPVLDSRDIGFLSPVSPISALRQMAEQRLLPGGGPGRAVFVIDQASLVVAQGLYLGNFAVHLDVLDDAGSRVGFAEARVSRSATAHDDGPAKMRAALYQLTRALMDDMNVELEFQVRRSLKNYLQTTAATAPVPANVDSQDLPPP